MADDESSSAPPGFPKDGKLFTLSEFKGLNTRSPRMAIDDQELSWSENFFPIAPGNYRTLWGKGANLYTTAGGKTIIYYYFYNIGNNYFAFVCLSDGSAAQVNTSTGSVTTISATPNTFYSGGSLPACSQWGSQYLLIAASVTANSYYIWDGSVLYRSGGLSPLINVVNGGSGYASAPSVTISGGSGTGATATATLTSGSVTSVTITNSGSGYVVGDTPIITFGGTSTAGSVTTITVINGGSGYTSAPTVAITGGGGAGATATAIVSAGVVTGFTVTASGSGFTSTPAIGLTGGGGSGAVAQARILTVAFATTQIMPIGISGTGIEVFTNRVWVINVNKLYTTDPGSITAFNTISTASDSFLRANYINLKQSNGFLYLIGDSSINVISNVQTSGSPSLTTFNNQNVDPQVGTPWPNSVVPFGRDIVFANTNGIYVMFGGAAEKVSEKLDGIFAEATLPLSGSANIPCAALHTIYGIKVYMILMTVIDDFTGAPTPKLMMWDGKKWFIGSQEVDMTFISTQEISSNLQPYGTDGTNLFPLFSIPSATLAKKARGKLWSGGSYLIDKQLLRVYTEGFDNAGGGYSLNLSVDTETSVTASTVVNTGGTITFVNSTGGAIQFQNSTFGNINFTVTGVTIQGEDIDSVYGKLMGFSFTSTSNDFTLTNMTILYKNYRFYG